MYTNGDLYQWTYTTSQSNLQRMMIWLRTIALQNNFDVILWKLSRPGAGRSEIVLPRLPQIVGLLNLSHLAGRSWAGAGVLVLLCVKCKRRVARNDLCLLRHDKQQLESVSIAQIAWRICAVSWKFRGIRICDLVTPNAVRKSNGQSIILR